MKKQKSFLRSCCIFGGKLMKHYYSPQTKSNLSAVHSSTTTFELILLISRKHCSGSLLRIHFIFVILLSQTLYERVSKTRLPALCPPSVLNHNFLSELANSGQGQWCLQSKAPGKFQVKEACFKARCGICALQMFINPSFNHLRHPNHWWRWWKQQFSNIASFRDSKPHL